MASATYTTNVVIIRKTKLSESDLILDMISEDCELIRAVAKSARKPGNTFSNRLDLFNVARITCAKCKNLDIIRECKLIESHNNIRLDLQRQSCASAICELIWRVTWDGSVNENIFDFVVKTLDLLNATESPHDVILCAALLKLLAWEGFRPAVDECCRCQNNILDPSLRFSYSDGGVICNNCSLSETDPFDHVGNLQIAEMSVLIKMRYEDILARSEDFFFTSKNLRIVDRMIQYYVGYTLKSLKIYSTLRNSVS